MTDEQTAWAMTAAQSVELGGGETESWRGPRWLMVLHGQARLDVAGAAQRLLAGDAVLVAPGRQVTVTAEVAATLAWSDLTPTRMSLPLPAVLTVRRFAERHPGIAAMVRLCPAATQCQHAPVTASYAQLLGAAMTASWLDDQGLAETGGDGAQVDPLVSAVIAAIRERPAEAWTVQRMAGVAHISRSALGARFRRELQRSPAEVLRDARMHEARRMLRTGSPVVEQVARAVGYGSAAAFSRAFAAQHGVPPQAWRDSLSSRSSHRSEDDATGGRQGGSQQERRLHSVLVH